MNHNTDQPQTPQGPGSKQLQQPFTLVADVGLVKGGIQAGKDAFMPTRDSLRAPSQISNQVGSGDKRKALKMADENTSPQSQGLFMPLVGFSQVLHAYTRTCIYTCRHICLCYVYMPLTWA